MKIFSGRVLKKERSGDAPADPASLGKRIAANHEAMMKELVVILDAKKTPEEMRPAHFKAWGARPWISYYLDPGMI